MGKKERPCQSGCKCDNPQSRHKYKEQYGVIVICDNESHQQKVYNKLAREGLKCRVVVT